jgi:hypothetical protein
MAHLFFPFFSPCAFPLFLSLPPFKSCSTVMLGLLFLWDFLVSALELVLFRVLGGDGWALHDAALVVQVLGAIWDAGTSQMGWQWMSKVVVSDGSVPVR